MQLKRRSPSPKSYAGDSAAAVASLLTIRPLKCQEDGASGAPRSDDVRSTTIPHVLLDLAGIVTQANLTLRSIRFDFAGHCTMYEATSTTSSSSAAAGGPEQQIVAEVPGGRTRLTVSYVGRASSSTAKALGVVQAAADRAARRIELGESIIGNSAPMQRLRASILKIANCDSTVLITGESGTGKEVAARMIHTLSGRAGKPFVAINCGALTESLLEAELFGTMRGAFTGASTNKKGLFAAAHGGTLFLDELGEMSPAMQVKLLRVLQERKVRPVGAHDAEGERPVDVRVIAATNRELEREVAQGRFRDDLYFRINVLTLRTPALRERRTDITQLTGHLLGKVYRRAGLSAPARLAPGAARQLAEYAWPGNVRELENKLECWSAMTGAELLITAEQVREALAEPKITVNASGDIEYQSVWRAGESVDEHFDRQLYELYRQVLGISNGNHAETARKFKLKRTTLHMRLENIKQRLAGA